MLPFEDRYTRQRQLPEVGFDGQTRLEQSVHRVPSVLPRLARVIAADYLRRAGVTVEPDLVLGDAPSHAVFDDAVFDDAVFDDAVFDDAVFDDAVFDDAVFDDAVLGEAVLGGAGTPAAGRIPSPLEHFRFAAPCHVACGALSALEHVRTVLAIGSEHSGSTNAARVRTNTSSQQ